MRLTCPNCDAQYEVPDEVIPKDGRDVQCSNCGNTWFQAHPDHVTEETKTGPEKEESAAPADVPPEPPQEMDPEVASILREEAEREARLRATETAAPLESQPDLGLDTVSAEEPPQAEPAPEPADETARRAREASERMARMRGEDPEAEEPAGTEPEDPGSRRDLLPDIEELNSSLRGSGDSGGRNAVSTVRAEPRAAKRGGFVRGFSLVLILGVILALVYINAAKISQSVPQVDPALASYVTLVDQARLWLDTQINQVLPR